LPLMLSRRLVWALTSAMLRLKLRVVGGDLGLLGGREVVADRVGDDEVAVGQPLHERRRAEPVRPWSEKFASPSTNSPGSCSSGCSPPRGRPSCSARPGRCASAACTGPRP
jgi:hypothetical protein